MFANTNAVIIAASLAGLLFATSTLAAPATKNAPEPTKHVKIRGSAEYGSSSDPSSSSSSDSSNSGCGTGETNYCCNTSSKSEVSCAANLSGAQCEVTTVCCDATLAIQVCLGNVNVNILNDLSLLNDLSIL